MQGRASASALRLPDPDPKPKHVQVTKARALSRLQSQAVQWLAMSCAINLSEGEGLQPFAVPEGWMAAPSAPPAQAFTNDQLIEEIERHEPALLALLEACAERAPSLCTPSAMLPLARLAAWTERDAWVRAPSGRARLQPSLAEAATSSDRGCNPVCVTQAATARAQAAALSIPGAAARRVEGRGGRRGPQFGRRRRGADEGGGHGGGQGGGAGGARTLTQTQTLTLTPTLARGGAGGARPG